MSYLHDKILKADKICGELNHPYVGTEHLLLSILKDNAIKSFVRDYELTYTIFEAKLREVVGVGKEDTRHNMNTPLLNNTIDFIEHVADSLDIRIDDFLILYGILSMGEGVAFRVLLTLEIDVVSMRDELELIINDNSDKSLKTLEKFNCLHNMCKEVKDDNIVVTGLDKELDELLHNMLKLKKPNTILIGEPGVGKTALVEKLAQAINNKEVPMFLQHLKIYQLSLSQAVAGTKYRGEFEEKITKVIETVEKRNDIVLFIDEIHTLNGAGGAEGAIDAGNIFKPVLARGKIKMIGATTTDEYNKHIKSDKALARRFNIITLIEPTKEETIGILTKAKEKYEKHFSIKISKKDIEEIYKNSTHKEGRMPDIALDALEEFSVNRYYEKQKPEKETVKC